MLSAFQDLDLELQNIKETTFYKGNQKRKGSNVI